jgi:hypothetical protein
VEETSSTSLDPASKIIGGAYIVHPRPLFPFDS